MVLRHFHAYHEQFHSQGGQRILAASGSGTTPKGNSAIYKGHYEGWFCARVAAYKTEDEYLKAEQPDEPQPA